MREEVREFKRQRILEVAERLFYEGGFDATSVDIVASELGVTKPFIYNYFPNKVAILEGLYERSAERLLVYVEGDGKSGGDPVSRLRSFVKLFVHENVKFQVGSGVYLQEEKHLQKEALARIRAIERKFNKRLTSLIQEGVEEKVFKVKNPDIASLSISGMVRWVHRWYRPDGRLGADEIADEIAEYALRIVGFD